MRRARQANTLLLEQQVQDNEAKAWYRVPFELANDPQSLAADTVGNYAAAAMQLHFHLTQHTKQAWAIRREGVIVHVRARHPPKALDELSYQVWYHQQRYQLEKMGGTLLKGNLVICESGLWFDAHS